jgi:predicted permease
MRAAPDRSRASGDRLPLRYRALLTLLPAHLRDEHDRELREDLALERPSMPAFAVDIARASLRAHLDVLRQDLALALRQLRRAPTFALATLVTLAAGLGGNVAFFSIVDGVLLRQLGYAGAERIMDVTEENIGRGMLNFGISPGNFRDAVRDSSIYAAAAVYKTGDATSRMGESRDRVSYVTVSGDFFRVFTERPLVGRTLRPEDDVAGGNAAVVSYRYWQRTLGGDPAVLGRTLELDGVPLRIVGVMPDGFDFPDASIALWRPIALDAVQREQRGARFVSGVARLRPGVTIAQASAAAAGASRALAATFPRTSDGWTVKVRELRAARVESVRTPLLLVWGAGALVLLIAVANVASLMLTRAVARERELALRVALGARVNRIVRQLVTEALVLSALGAAAGVGLASVVLGAVRPLASDFVPRMNEVAVNGRALAYAGALALGTTVLLSMFALSSARRDRLWSALGSARTGVSRRRRRTQRAIVVCQVALAAFVIVASGLVVRSLTHVLSQPLGFDPRDVLTFRVEPPWPPIEAATPEQFMAALAVERRRADESFTRLMERLEALPGVGRAGAVNRLPLTGNWWTTSIALADRSGSQEAERLPVLVRPVTSGYFAAMGTRLLRGRGFVAADRSGAERAIVVDEEFAHRVWGDEDPMGRPVLLSGPPDGPQPAARVVGVVEGVHMNRLDADLRPTMYVPFAQAIEGHYLNWGMDVVVRGGARLGETTVREVVRDVFPEAVVFHLATMHDVVRRSTADRRFQLLVLGFFGALALLLATIGVSGTILLSVRERREELAVRSALGAGARRLWWSTQLDGLTLALSGAAIGLAAAILGARLFSSVVYGVETRDPAALVGAVVAVLVAAFVGTTVPALVAMRVDPAAAMRE